MIRTYATAAVAVSVLAGLAWGGRALHRAGADAVRAEWAASDARLAEEARLLAQERAAALGRIDRVAVTQTRVSRVAAVSAAVAGDGLRIRAQAVAARCDASPASSGETAGGPGGVLADVLGRLEAAGRELAATADERGVAGSACQDVFAAVR